MGKGQGSKERVQLYTTDMRSAWLVAGTPYIVIKHESQWWLDAHGISDQLTPSAYGPLKMHLKAFGLDMAFDSRKEAVNALKKTLSHFPDISTETKEVTEIANLMKKTYSPIFKAPKTEREAFAKKLDMLIKELGAS